MLQSSSVASLLRPGDLAPGDRVGHWRVEHELGRGGMGTVYAVLHTEIGKRAALKVIHLHSLTDEYDAERFLREARAVNAVTHPNIVDIFESGMLDDGRPYLVMERLRGQTLGDRQEAGRIPALEIIETLLPLCDALAAAHALGIVHRDIKLDNIFLCDPSETLIGAAANAGPTVKLLDWGIASMVNRDGERSYGNLMVGTPRYVAPEQARGERVTTASDVYSLGVVAYELFLEEPPFQAASAAELLVLHLTEPPPMPHEVWPQIPQVLEDLLLNMLAKTPSLRPTVTEVAGVLLGLREQLRPRATTAPGDADRRPITAPRRPITAPRRPITAPKAAALAETAVAALLDPPRRRWQWAAVGAMMLLAVGGFRLSIGSGGAPRAAAAAVSAEPAPVAEAELVDAPPISAAEEPGPALSDVPTPETLPAHRAPRVDAATAATRPAVSVPARAATVAPAPRPHTTEPTPRKPTPRRLHPDAVIDPY